MRQSPWEFKSPHTNKNNQSIQSILGYLRELEATIASIDKYVDYCIKKYKSFKFNIKIFMNDDFITRAQFV